MAQQQQASPLSTSLPGTVPSQPASPGSRLSRASTEAAASSDSDSFEPSSLTDPALAMGGASAAAAAAAPRSPPNPQQGSARGNARGAQAPSSRSNGSPVSAQEEEAGRVNLLDRFGFLVDADLEDPRFKRQRIRKLNERLEKWQAMLYAGVENLSPSRVRQETAKSKRRKTAMLELSSSDAALQQVRMWNAIYPKRKGKIKSRVRKGIPEPLRGQVWQLLSGSRELRAERPPDYYATLRKRKPSDADIEQINKDIDRSFRTHKEFSDRGGRFAKSLSNVLCAFAVHDPLVGYCQGIDGIAALMLMYMEEEEAFWVLSALAAPDSRWALQRLWTPGMPLLRQYFFIFEHLVKETMPRLARHFEQQDILSPSMYQAAQWFVNVFLSSNMEFETVLRIWDVFMHEGIKVVFRVGLALLKLEEKTLLGLEMGEMIEHLKASSKTVDVEVLLSAAFDVPLKRKTIARLSGQFEVDSAAPR